MLEKPQHKVYQWLVKYHRILSIFLTIILLVVFYFYIKSQDNNHLSHTHVMYFVIVFAGSVLGSIFGVITAIIAGILVGPLMPYNLITGEGQLFKDWFFRLLMMVSVGIMSGYFSRNYRYVQKRVKDLNNIFVESKLYNYNYLSDQTFIDDKPYLIMSMIIQNHKTISEVAGYKAYYEYLRKINDHVITLYPTATLVQVAANKLWLVTELENYNQQIEQIALEIKKINQVLETKLFVDFGIGFHEIRMDHKKTIYDYL